MGRQQHIYLTSFFLQCRSRRRIERDSRYTGSTNNADDVPEKVCYSRALALTDLVIFVLGEPPLSCYILLEEVVIFAMSTVLM